MNAARHKPGGIFVWGSVFGILFLMNMELLHGRGDTWLCTSTSCNVFKERNMAAPIVGKMAGEVVSGVVSTGAEKAITGAFSNKPANHGDIDQPSGNQHSVANMSIKDILNKVFD